MQGVLTRFTSEEILCVLSITNGTSFDSFDYLNDRGRLYRNMQDAIQYGEIDQNMNLHYYQS